MAATILNSPRAIQMSVYVVRAFVRFRQSLASQNNLAKELDALKRSVATLDVDTRRQFDQVYEAILGLMAARACSAPMKPPFFDSGMVPLSCQGLAPRQHP